MFQIVPATGQLLTKSRLNYEALDLPEDGPSGGQYKTIKGSKVTATDTADRYGKIVGPVPVIQRDEPKKADPNPGDTNANIVVNDENETPLIMSITVKAGTTEVSQFSEDRTDTTVGSYDVEGGDDLDTVTVTWSVEGSDAADFSIGNDGALAFKAVPDFENPTDRDEDAATAGNQGAKDNVYRVTVKATLGTGADAQTAIRAVTVTVTNVDELGTLSGPTPAPDKYAENSTADLGAYTVTAIEGVTPKWSLEGADSDDFMLVNPTADDADTVNSKVLKFKDESVPDYEMPTDRDEDPDTAGDQGAGDNMYKVTVKAENGGETQTMAVTVTVTNAEEAGTVTLTPTRPSVGTRIEANVTDPDGGVTGTWQWASHAAPTDGTTAPAADSEDWSDISGATDASYTPDAADNGKFLRATASYTDGHGSGKTAMAVSESAVALVTITDGPETVSYLENGTDAVGTYTGDPADDITWSLKPGDDASAFSISTGGVLSFRSSPNYESPGDANSDNIYMVTVVATADVAIAERLVRVTVTNVDEAGTVTITPRTWW